jgi:hypothetical protein
MKYLHVIIALSLMFFVWSCWKSENSWDNNIPKPLWEIQSVWTQQKTLQETLKNNIAMWKDQKVLFEISDIFNTHGEEYHAMLIQILKKYKNPVTPQDIESLILLLSQHHDRNTLKTEIWNTFSISILESDIGTLKEGTLKFMDEREAQKLRFENQESIQLLH